jgi:Tfp pilus assembly protein PilV
MTPPAPLPSPRADESGFIIIEVLVSALILAIVAGAVLALITATTHSAAAGRSHSTAYALAQEDLAQMRTLQLTKLNGYKEVETGVNVGGNEYTIESRGVFINNQTGTYSCTEANGSADYAQITSTVSSPTLLTPVTLQSIVSPTSGSLDPTHGAIDIQVNNALEQGVSGVLITGTGPTSLSGITDVNGCANFADIPYGNYKMVATGKGLITPEGTETWSQTVAAPAKATQQVPIHFDKPGNLEASFEYLEPKTNTLVPAQIDSMEVYQSSNGQKTITVGTPQSTPRVSSLSKEKLYPFTTKYAVYAGSCTTNNPDPEGKNINQAAIGTIQVKGGTTAASEPAIQVPALNLGVTYENKAVKGATVILTDNNCKYNGSNVRREYTTDKAGHIFNGGTPAELEAETLAVGVPFGTYTICASAKINSTEYRKAELSGSSSVTVNNLATAVAKNMALTGTKSTTSC